MEEAKSCFFFFKKECLYRTTNQRCERKKEEAALDRRFRQFEEKIREIVPLMRFTIGMGVKLKCKSFIVIRRFIARNVSPLGWISN